MIKFGQLNCEHSLCETLNTRFLCKAPMFFMTKFGICGGSRTKRTHMATDAHKDRICPLFFCKPKHLDLAMIWWL